MSSTYLNLRELQERWDRWRCQQHPDKRIVLKMHDGEHQPICVECNGVPTSMIEAESPTQAYRRGKALPAAVRTHIERKVGEWDMTQQQGLALRKPTEIELAKMGEEWSKDIDGFGELKRADKVLAAQLYMAGFQRFHIAITHGKVGLTIDGWTWWAQRSYGAAYGGYDTRPMTRDEREFWGLEADEIGAVCTMYRVVKGVRFPVANDIGRAGGKRDANQPVAKTNKAEMAMKRAIARTLRRGAPLGIDVATIVADYEILPTIEGESREEESAPAETLALSAGVDSPPEEAPATTPVSEEAKKPSPPQPVAGEPVKGGTPKLTGVLKPRLPPWKPEQKVRDADAVGRTKAALLKDGVTEQQLREFSYALQVGKDAVMQLVYDGYGSEQIVAILTGEAKPDLGW